MAIGTVEHNLQGFIDEVLEVLRGLFDNAYIPDNPDIAPGIFPYVTVYMSNGTSKIGPATVLTNLDDPVIAVLVPLDDYGKAVDFLLPYREQIPMALYNWFYIDSQSAHAQHIGEDMTITLGPIDWPGIAIFGYLITLNTVKIQNEVS